MVKPSQLSLKPLWVFSHIPKTAGTSFDRYLAQFFQLKDILHVNAPDLNQLPQVVHLKKGFPKLISGHHPMHGLLYQLLPPRKIVHIALMRRPIDRVISYYNYISTREYHALNKRVSDLSFDEFLSQTDVPELRNGQSRRLVGLLHSDENIPEKEIYQLAKKVIDDCFTIVGVTEKLSDLSSYLNKKLQSKTYEIPRMNSSGIKVLLSELTMKQRLKIESMNKVDIQLYEYVRSINEKLLK